MTTDQAGRERRRHPRVPVTVRGRFLAPDGSEHACAIRDMSLSGIALVSDTPVPMGANLIVYLDDFGRFEGTVVRGFEGGFAIETTLSGPRRARIAERLATYANGGGKGAPGNRTHPRYAPHEAGIDEGSILTFSDGTSVPCRIVDMSLGGANVKTELRAPIGSEVSIGLMRGHVVRHTEDGVAISFADIPEHATALSRPFG